VVQGGFETGDPVLHRNVELGIARFVVPSIVVSDTPEETRLFRRHGTPIKAAACFALRADPAAYEDAAIREVKAGHWDHIDAVWKDTDMLQIARSSEWYSVWLMWISGEFAGFYVNFECPWERTAHGFDTTDLCLDLMVSPAYKLHWKDGEAFERRTAEGLITPEQAAEVRRATLTVLTAVDARQGAFAGDDIAWRPDPAWRVPTLTEGWNDKR
jgi:hypothetical protein